MRPLFLLVLAACGRLGFDDLTASDAASDGPVDATPGVPDLCNVQPAGVLALPNGERPTKLRAAALSAGFAVAVETTLVQTFMVRVDGAGAVVGTTLPFSPDYALQGISQLEDRPFVYVHSGGTGFIKLLLPDWASYDTGPAGDPAIADPQQAPLPGGTTAVFGTFSSGLLGFGTIDAANNQTTSVGTALNATFASFGATPTGVRVAVEDNAQTCATFEITGAGVGPTHTFSPCVEPRLATLGGQGAIVYRTTDTGPIAVHRIPEDASDPGVTKLLEVGTNPRIAAIDGAIWVGYVRGDGVVRLVRFVDDTVTMRDLPGLAPTFDLTPARAFWITDTGEVNAATPCL